MNVKMRNEINASTHQISFIYIALNHNHICLIERYNLNSERHPLSPDARFD